MIDVCCLVSPVWSLTSLLSILSARIPLERGGESVWLNPFMYTLYWTISTELFTFIPNDLHCSITARDGNVLSGICEVEHTLFSSLFPIKVEHSHLFDMEPQPKTNTRQAASVIELGGFLGPGLWVTHFSPFFITESMHSSTFIVLGSHYRYPYLGICAKWDEHIQ